MICVCLVVFFVNVATVNIGQLYTFSPWYHDEPKIPKAFKYILTMKK